MLLISVLFLATAVEAQPWGGGRQLAKAKPCETACMNGAYEACKKSKKKKTTWCCKTTCSGARKVCKKDLKSECKKSCAKKSKSKKSKAACKECMHAECKNGVLPACEKAHFCKMKPKAL